MEFERTRVSVRYTKQEIHFCPRRCFFGASLGANGPMQPDARRSSGWSFFVGIAPDPDCWQVLTQASHTALRALQNSDTAGGTDPTGGHDARAEVETLLTYQTEFQRQLLRHLSDEEDLVVPVILEHGFTG